MSGITLMHGDCLDCLDRMTQDQILTLASEAGADVHHGSMGQTLHVLFSSAQLQRFAALVAEVERDACAKVCGKLAELSRIRPTDSMWQHGECAAAIRARGGNV